MAKLVTLFLQRLYDDDDKDLPDALQGWSIGGWTLVSGTVADYKVDASSALLDTLAQQLNQQVARANAAERRVAELCKPEA